MYVLLKNLRFFAMLAFVATSAAQEREQAQSARIEHGELSVTFRDNSQSPQVLSGIDALFNIKHAADYDAYDPDTRGASAGLNFEHVISGHANPNNKFTPRHGQYTLHKLPDGKSVLLERRAEDCPWKVASTLKYTVNEPHYIDFEFRCTPHDAALFGRRGYAVFFFANYMNDVKDVSLHFRGHRSIHGKEEWITVDAPKGHPDWNGGGNYRALSTDDLEYDDDVRFRLNSWSYDWPRITMPFYYGRANRGMTFMLMFDRLHSDRDQIRFSLYKFKLPKHPRPAWDFQYVINKVESGAEYGFRGRLVWKKFVSAEDCLNEYERWVAAHNDERARLYEERVQRLKRLGATVLTRDDDVIEVNANRRRIADKDLALVSEFTQMTDLSLEETTISDAGLVHLRNLQQLEWLNLYRSRIGDQGLKEVSRLKSLQHLPIGETKVTDDGLDHLSDMKQLEYLGLRGNNVTDDGVKHVRELVRLTGLHLGETRVTDAGLTHLLGMTSLQKLWLDETTVSDKAIATLARLKSLRELHIAKTKITTEGVKRLAALLPQCRIVDETP
ncbi:MAG: hypothetical protein CMJ64_10630 [Planctomycetaceae bacterium]|nr:hypothetical protein [Planctomycetaceae bacterium]